MANLSSIARPYALAAFEHAREKQQLSAWKVFLESAAEMVNDPMVGKLLKNPEMSVSVSGLFLEVLASVLGPEQKNFLLLLEQNKRLPLLPEIASQFKAYHTAFEKISNVRVITAVEAQKDFQQKLAQALNKRVQHEVSLHYEVNPAIIGGAIIHIGDRVIDGSVRGKLTRLLQNLMG